MPHMRFFFLYVIHSFFLLKEGDELLYKTQDGHTILNTFIQ